MEMRELNKFLKYFQSIYSNYNKNEWPKVGRNFQLETINNDLHDTIPDSGQYISEQLRAKINKLKMVKYRLNYTYQNTYIVLEFVCSKKTTKKTLQKIYHILNFIIYYCSILHNGNALNELNIKLVLSPFKKNTLKRVIPNGALSTYNINNGMTSYYNINKASILIYRSEELIKVLIHEIIHAYKIDSAFNGKSLEDNINNLFKLSNDVNTNESFTETYACILNVCLASCMFYDSSALEVKGKHMLLYDIFIELFKIEITHISRVAVRALEHEHVFLKGRTLKFERGIKREDTHITSYYFLKCINLVNMEKFLEYLIRNNYTIGNLRDYIAFLETLLLQKHNFQNSICKIKTYNNKSLIIHSNLKNIKLIKNAIEIADDTMSLRMSCIDTIMI
jgi:hypothetical protein